MLIWEGVSAKWRIPGNNMTANNVGSLDVAIKRNKRWLIW
jgi:hypothetical protein